VSMGGKDKARRNERVGLLETIRAFSAGC